MRTRVERGVRVPAMLVTMACLAMGLYVALGAQGDATPRYTFDPEWPRPLPNKWKLGGVIGIGMQDDNSLWVYNRPGDLTSLELEAELGVSAAAAVPMAMPASAAASRAGRPTC